MASFTSDRERRLWRWTLAVIAAIYATLPFAGALAQVLIERRVLDAAFAFAFTLVVIAIAGIALKRRPAVGQREIWVALGLIAVYAMVVVRMGIGPAERTHIFEYGLVAVLIHQALLERRRNGGRVRAPAALAVLATALVGWLDEGIQAVIPGRVYDLRDVGINALAGLMAIVATLILGLARRYTVGRRAR